MGSDAAPPDGEDWKPDWRLKAAFLSIAIVNLATALDATIISVALPVSLLDPHRSYLYSLPFLRRERCYYRLISIY